jgi:MFS family permease
MSRGIAHSVRLPHRHILIRPSTLSSGFRALHNRNYRLYWFSQLISQTGSWMQTTAQAWLVLNLTGSPMSLGVVTMLQFLPVTLLALYGGVLADRLRKRRALLLTQSIATMQACFFGFLVATDVIQLWHIYILAMVQGLLNAIEAPTRQAFVVEMVGRDDLSNAVALNSMQFNAARIVGPSVAGLIIDRIGIAPTLILNAISFIPVLAALLRMDSLALHVVPPSTQGSVNRRLREGLSYARHTPAIMTILIVVTAIGTFGYNFSIVLPLLARFVLNTDATGFGSLASFLGFGSLVGALATAYVKELAMRRMLIGAGAFSIILGGLAVSRLYALSAVLLVGLGMAGITFATASNTLLQLASPDALRGRIMSVYVLLFMGSTPIGGLTIGVLSDTFGVQAALLTCAVLCTCGVGIATFYRWRRSPAPAEVNPV